MSAEELTGWERRALTIACTICDARVGEWCHRDSGGRQLPHTTKAFGVHATRVKESTEAERTVDIFKRHRDGSPFRAMLVLRWVIEVGVTTLADMKREFHRIGAAQTNIMHTFDRYIARDLVEAKLPARVLLREGKSGRSYKIRWCGSKGDSFEERAANWLATFDDAALEAAHGAVETEYVMGGEERALAWLKIVKHEIAIRSLGIATRITERIDARNA